MIKNYFVAVVCVKFLAVFENSNDVIIRKFFIV